MEEMKNNEHIIDLLTAYVCGTLSGKEKRRLEAQLKTDRKMAELCELIKQLRRAGEKTDWTRTQDTAAKLSAQLFDDYQKRKKSGARRGVTVFDSRILPLPEGVRPATVSTRRMKFAFADLNMELSLYPITTDSYELIGRISGLESYDNVSVVIRSGKTSFRTATDHHGLFRFERVPALIYTLAIKSGNRICGTIDIEL